jgi:hypothetical protein
MGRVNPKKPGGGTLKMKLAQDVFDFILQQLRYLNLPAAAFWGVSLTKENLMVSDVDILERVQAEDFIQPRTGVADNKKYQ